MRYRLAVFVVVASLAVVGAARAQSSNAALTGLVTDPSKAVIQGAKVVALNAGTNVRYETTTNATGSYYITNLPPGTYRIEVELVGFKTVIKPGVVLNVQDVREINFEMALGSTAESITVTSPASFLHTQDAVTGQTIDRTFINDLPLISRSALDLAFLTPGVNQPPSSTYGQAVSSVPYLTGNNFVSNGSRNATSDIQIDGVSSGETVSGGLNNFASYTPSVDAVQEFKVQQTNFSAEYGFSGATITNVITRSGTNSFHGSAFEFLRNDKLDANNYFNDQGGLKLPPLRQNIFGGTIGGPVFKNRTFFFFDYEGTRQHSLGSVIAGVPSAAEKQGNFGELCTLQGGAFGSNGMCSNPNGQLWDPYIATFNPSTGSPVRSAFIPNNNMATYQSPSSQLAAVPGNLIDPVAQKLMGYFPLPNRFVGASSYDRFNNWIGSGINTLNNDQWDLKIDHHFSDRNILSAKYAKRGTFQHALNCFGNLADPCTQGPVDSSAHLFSLNFNHIFSGATVLSLSYGLTRTARFYHTIKGDYPSLDPVTTLGMPSYIDTSGVPQLPAIYVEEYSSASGGASIGTGAWSYLKDGQDTHDLLAALSHLRGRHELKFGGEFRMHRFNNGQPGVPGGLFTYEYTGTSQNYWSGGGDAMATFLTGGSPGQWGQYEIPAFLATQNFAWAGYAQDNFHVSRKLTANVGLRYDLTLPTTERHNELSWLDPNAISPLQVPGLGTLRGGNMFTDSRVRTNFDTDHHDFQPRFGLAYSLNDKTVVRTGYGIYFDPSKAAASADAVESQGFAQVTPWVSTNPVDHATPYGRLSNPYPNGVKLPPGRSLGLLTNVGFNVQGPERSLNSTPYEQSWSFGIQRALPWNVLVDATYIGKKGTHLYFGASGDMNLNHLGPQEEHYSAAQIAALNTFVPNPFFGIITDPNSNLSHPTVNQYQLDLPYPQFGNFLIFAPPWANSIYHAFQLRVEKRFSNGLQFLFTYVNSKSIDDASLPNNGNNFLGGSTATILDPNNLALERSISQFDIPQVWQFSYVYQLPIGRGKRFGGGMNPVLNAVIGGWQTNGIWRFDNGQPLILGLTGGQALPGYGQRPEVTGVPRRNHGSTASVLNQYFVDPTVFSVPARYTLGNTGRTLSLRAPGTANATLSVFKEFPIDRVREGMRLEYRLESFNAFNHPQFCPPNTVVGGGSLGVTTCQANLPREVQMALKLYF